jgi:hypothetical protein
MPVFDPDGYMIWQHYNPRIITGRLPPKSDKPFYFGGSQVPSSLGLNPMEYSGTGLLDSVNKIKTRVVKKLPNKLLRK